MKTVDECDDSRGRNVNEIKVKCNEFSESGHCSTWQRQRNKCYWHCGSWWQEHLIKADIILNLVTWRESWSDCSSNWFWKCTGGYVHDHLSEINSWHKPVAATVINKIQTSWQVWKQTNMIPKEMKIKKNWSLFQCWVLHQKYYNMLCYLMPLWTLPASLK
jgi:hypothetical protein